MRRVLLIGVDGALEHDLRGALGRECTVDTCARGVDAIRRLKMQAYDVAVARTDPATEQDGLGYVAELRRARPGLREILLTAGKTPDRLLGALRANVFACFGAPYQAKDVADMVHRALDAEDWRDGIEVLSAKPDWISLKVSCRLINADRLVHFMSELQADVGGELIQAFREVLLNAMEHGAGFDPEKVISISAIRTTRSILYHFRDPGTGFRLSELPHAALSNPPDDPFVHVAQREAKGLRPGGFGLLLTMQIADEVIFNESGNEVLLIKRMS